MVRIYGYTLVVLKEMRSRTSFEYCSTLLKTPLKLGKARFARIGLFSFPGVFSDIRACHASGAWFDLLRNFAAFPDRTGFAGPFGVK